MPQPTEDDRTVRPFGAILQEIAAGRLHNRLSEQLADLTTAVHATGKKGTVTLTITVAPIKAGVTDTLVVSGRSVCKAPEGEDAFPSSVFFPDAAGNLTRNDPNQPTLPLRGLDTTREATA
ncbi:hypothetical protein O7627_24275 [Solwaraspora sp. WMMD1047]|uniref:hypothetical protein n=1 Tax=Solwaraspora sp. WMMD1047 TaxID=3016102 RepID=UPI0024168BB8|nr:hypothetical protein [Solwaraspora sp. WMMD1047]MDG4832400.1 hypothetical protein [Solwaraspora sp. WMMD1047]